MNWFYVTLMFVLAAGCGWGTYKCVKNWEKSPPHILGAMFLFIGAGTTLILGMRAVAYSNVTERSNVMITKVSATVENSAPMKVELNGVYADRTSAYYFCGNPFMAGRCAQLHPGDVVVFVETHNEFGFSQTVVEFPEDATNPE